MTAVALLWLQLAAPVNPCAAMADSLAATAADTSSGKATALTRRLDLHCHDDFDALFGAGAALARAAHYRAFGTANPTGGLAVRLLGRAVQLRPRHAVVWLAYGVALRKTGGVQVDANRAIQNALRLADQFPDSTPAPLLAQIYEQAALYLQDWVDRTRWLKDGSRLGVVTLACTNWGAFCENFTHPGRFNDELQDAFAIDPDFAERRGTLLDYYRHALRSDPSNLEVMLRDARELSGLRVVGILRAGAVLRVSGAVRPVFWSGFLAGAELQPACSCWSRPGADIFGAWSASLGDEVHDCGRASGGPGFDLLQSG